MLEKTKETLKPGNINIIEPLKKKKKKGGGEGGWERRWGKGKKKKEKEQKEITVDVFQERTCYAV